MKELFLPAITQPLEMLIDTLVLLWVFVSLFFLIHFIYFSFYYSKQQRLNITQNRECVRAGAAGSQTRRFLGHHLLHPLILRLLVLCAPADLKTQRIDCAHTCRSKFLTHSLGHAPPPNHAYIKKRT